MAIVLIVNLTCKAQDVTGSWYGLLKVQEMELKIVFNISRNDTTYSATMDSPDQGVKGIPIDKVSYVNSVLFIGIKSAQIEYSGVLLVDKFLGTFRQSGQSFPLNLSKRPFEAPKRPQEPKPPFGYNIENVTFENSKAGISLAGTLTLPSDDAPYPTAILISGSGPQTRDEEILGHKPFWVIADHLTKNGIAVLRFDDRGVGSSKGNFATATTLDFVSDVEAAIDYLKTRKEVNPSKIGLIGHSEGGIVAPLVANNRNDISFIVMLAGTCVKGSEIILAQQELIARASGISDEQIADYKKLNQDIFRVIDIDEKNPELKNIITTLIVTASAGNAPADLVKQQVEQLTSPWMLFFLKYDPSIAMREVKCPVLAINGDKDLQVPSSMNLRAINESFNKKDSSSNNTITKTNTDVTTMELEGLNHLFQTAQTGLPAEYQRIEETFSPAALKIIADWILVRVK